MMKITRRGIFGVLAGFALPAYHPAVVIPPPPEYDPADVAFKRVDLSWLTGARS